MNTNERAASIIARLDPAHPPSPREFIREARVHWRETRGAEVIEDGIPAGPAGSTCRASHGFRFLLSQPQLHRTRFTLLPNAHAMILGVLLSAAGVGMSYVGISGLIGTKVLGAAPPGAFGGAIILLMGLVLDLFGPLTFLAGATAAGSVTVRNDLREIELGPPRFHRRTLPLDEVRAIQLCSGGILTLETKRGKPVHQKETWQANIVLRGEECRRINLADNGRRTAVERFGRELARAAGIPLLDHTHIKAPPAAFSAKPSLKEVYDSYRAQVAQAGRHGDEAEAA